VFEAYRFKYYDVAELDAKLAEGVTPGHEMIAEVLLRSLLENSLAELGFRPEARAEFTAWEDVVIDVNTALARRAARDTHRYRVRALLNGPLVDQDEPIVLASLSDWIDTVLQGPITLEAATDLLLEETSQRENPVLEPALRRTNAALSFTVGLGADEPVERYRNLYPLAAHVAGRALRFGFPRHHFSVLLRIT